MRIDGGRGLANFQDPGGWPMSDNDIFQGGSDPRGHFDTVRGLQQKMPV